MFLSLFMPGGMNIADLKQTTTVTPSTTVATTTPSPGSKYETMADALINNAFCSESLFYSNIY